MSLVSRWFDSVTGRDVRTSLEKPMPVQIPDGVTIDPTGLASETTLSEVASNTAALVTAAESTAPVNVYPAPTTPVSGFTTAMTGTTATAVTGVGQGGTGKFNYITQVTVLNTDLDTGTVVWLKDGAAGNNFYPFIAPAATNSSGVLGAVVSFPTPLKQPTADTALYAVNATTGASVILAAVGYQA
jgi:hypothetical protein